MRKISIFELIFFMAVSFLSASCHKEVTKDDIMQTKIPPSSARIVGEIISIEPVSYEYSGPCEKYPCIADVSLESIEYGAAFPVLSVGKKYRMKFDFTLSKTTKEMFPDMDKPLPGLEPGDKFEAMVSHSLKMEGSKQPEFEIASYSKK